MNILANITCGSTLFGTNLPGSDLDIKTVYAPSYRDLFIGNVKKNPVKTDSTDHTYESAGMFANHIREGQVQFIECLFAPENLITDMSPEYKYLYDNRDKLLSKQLLPFIAYSRTQTETYTNKVRKYNELVELKSFLNSVPDLDGTQLFLAATSKFSYPRETVNNRTFTTLFGKCIHENASKTIWHQVVDAGLITYGSRTKNCTNYDGKALGHACRIVNEAIEILQYGTLQLPRPEASFLISIRKEEIPYKTIEQHLENSYNTLQELLKTSTLREFPDEDVLTNFLILVATRYYLPESLRV